MKRLSLILSVCLLALSGCIDRDFAIDEVSGEMTVGGEELVLPLATLDKVEVDTLLPDNGFITSDDKGDYQLYFSSFGDDDTQYKTFSIGGVSIPAIRDISPVIEPVTFVTPELPASISMSAISLDSPINYPTIGNAVEVSRIEKTKDLSLGLPITGAGNLTEAMLALQPEMATVNVNYSDQMYFEAEVNVLKEFKRINFVEFGCEDHPYGAPLEITLDLNGVTDINGGGTLNLNVVFPDGYYLRDESGNDYPAQTHNIVSKSITIAAKQRTVKVIAYLNKIDYSGRELSEGLLLVKDDITYNVELNLNIVAGVYDMSAKPKISFVSAPEYKDVEVVLQNLDIPSVSKPIHYAFNGLNSSISIEKIAFTSAPLRLKMSGLEWLDVDVGVLLTLPSYLHLGDISNASLVSSGENTIATTIRKLEQGVTLNLQYIDTSDTSLCKQENGQLVLDGEVVAKLDLSSLNDHEVLLSTLTPTTPSVNINVGIAEATLAIDATNSVISTVASEVFDFNLEDQLPKLTHTVELPSQVVSIKEVGICNADDTTKPVAFNITVASGSTTFPVNTLDVDIAVNLGKMLTPTQEMLDAGQVKVADNGDYILVIKEEWNTATPISKRVEFDALRNLPQVEAGKMTIEQSFPVSGSVAIKSGESINLAESAAAVVRVDIAVDDIKMTTFTGKLDVGLTAEAMSVELDELSSLGVNVGTMTINPVLKVNIADNTSGVPLYAEATLKLLDTLGNQFSTIKTPRIKIAATGPTKIVLSTPKNESKYSGEGVTFVGMDDLAKLLANGIPAKIVVDMKVASDKDNECSIALTNIEQGVALNYQYEVLIPLSFDDALNMSFESKATGMNNIFAEVASATNGLTVNDVSLLAELGTNIPFDIIITAELIDANGSTDGVEAKLDLEECVIAGYTPEFGQKRTSNVAIKFDLGESKSLESLKSVDGIRFKFTVCNTEQETAVLNKSQFLEGKIKLRLRDGVSVDVFELLKSLTEEE